MKMTDTLKNLESQLEEGNKRSGQKPVGSSTKHEGGFKSSVVKLQQINLM